MAKFLMGNAFLMGRSVSKWAGQYNFPISPARSPHIAISEHVVKLCPANLCSPEICAVNIRLL